MFFEIRSNSFSKYLGHRPTEPEIRYVIEFREFRTSYSITYTQYSYSIKLHIFFLLLIFSSQA